MSAAQQKELISKFWDQVSEFWGLTLPNTRQGKKIRKDFLVACKQLVDDTISVGNAAQSAEESVPAPKKSTTKRVKAESEIGEPKSKKVVTIEPKAKKSTKKAEIQSPVPTLKKKSATSNKK